MRCRFLLLLAVALSESRANNRSEPRRFPDGFVFGSATASYQIEGAWDEDGKAPSIWDHVTHADPCFALDCQNGDVAVDSYHQIERDVEMIRELGLDHYRFSLSWPRILPNSFTDKINQAGVDYYSRLIDELLKHNVEPIITIYHWDLPQKLQEMGGWTNPAIVDWFADYSRVVFTLFGDKVKRFITINEPYQVCYEGYGDVRKAPAIDIKGVADYMCAKNLLLAHARAYKMYHEEFRREGGQVFISFSMQWYEPATDSPEDIQAAADARDFIWGLYVNPIFAKEGDYPAVVKQRVAARSAELGYPRTRLQEFTPEEVAYIRGTSDIFGLNHYTTWLVYRNASTLDYHPAPSLYDDIGAVLYQLNEWKIGESEFTKSVPWGFYKLLREISVKYDNTTIFITENGLSSWTGLRDEARAANYRAYLDALLDAIEDGSDILGYTAWSMMDNFEWRYGYTERFGLYEVDFNSAQRTRTPRLSAHVYKHVVRTRSLDFGYEPDTDVMTIDAGH